MLLVLTAGDVRRLLPIAVCIERMGVALQQLAQGKAENPLRWVFRVPQRRALIGMMPGMVPGMPGAAGDPPWLGLKAVSVFPDNHGTRLDSHQGFVLLFEGEHGRPRALVDASAITETRTAAVSGLATRLLARDDASDLAILGTGVQARSHLAAMLAVRDLRRVRVYGPDGERLERFVRDEGARHGIDVEAAGSEREAVAGADVVCTVTNARRPILQGDWLAPGTHVNAVGACMPADRELDSDAVARARVFVDRRESALAEAGDLLIPLREGTISEDHVAGELGDLLLGRLSGRQHPEQLTLFKSLGLAVEDLAAASLAYERALAENAGTRIDLGDDG